MSKKPAIIGTNDGAFLYLLLIISIILKKIRKIFSLN